MEQKILSALLSRDNYDKAVKAIKRDDFSPHGQMIFDAVEDFYSKDASAKVVDMDILQKRINRKLSSPKHKEMFADVLNDIAQHHSVPNILEEVFAYKRSLILDELSVVITNEQGNKDKILELMDEFNEWCRPVGELEEEDGVLHGVAFEDLFVKVSDENLIPLYPKNLNALVNGGIMRGQTLFAFGRPDSGKTSFSINLAASLCNAGYRVGYVGNEDPHWIIMARFWARFAGIPAEQLKDSPEETEALIRKRGYENLIMAPMTPGSPREIEKFIVDYQPDVLIVDQIRNLRIPKTDGLTQVLDAAATLCREWARRYNIAVVGITQAGESGKFKPNLEMEDVEYSNTGVAAQADIMVGIGMDKSMMARGLRNLSVCKNKRTEGHPYCTVKFDAKTSRMISL